MTKFYPQKATIKQKNLLKKDDQEEEAPQKEQKPQQEEVTMKHRKNPFSYKQSEYRGCQVLLVSWVTLHDELL